MRSLVAVAAALLLGLAQAGGYEMPATPAPVDEIVYARPFRSEQPMPFAWRAGTPEINEGQILVLRVSPALVQPRQSAEPVLYVGDQTAERINTGLVSGHLIVIVPGKPDLCHSPIWFGTPALPERVDVDTIAAERALASAARIGPRPCAEVGKALVSGGDRLRVSSREDLLRRLAPLIQRYAPDEADLADGFLRNPGDWTIRSRTLRPAPPYNGHRNGSSSITTTNSRIVSGTPSRK